MLLKYNLIKTILIVKSFKVSMIFCNAAFSFGPYCLTCFHEEENTNLQTAILYRRCEIECLEFHRSSFYGVPLFFLVQVLP